MKRIGFSLIELLIVVGIVAIIGSIALGNCRKPSVPEGPLDLSAVTQPGTTQPGSVGIFFCLDISPSMAQPLNGVLKSDIARNAMTKVLEQIAAYVRAHPGKRVEVGICLFDGTPRVVLPLRPFDLAAATQAIANLPPGNATAVGAAIETALAGFLAASDETKAILVMSDGESNRGRDPAEVVRAIKQNDNNRKILTADVDVYLVAFDVNADLFTPVKEAGAKVLEARDPESLKSIMQSMVEEVLLEAP
jgi:prepilin-type N-terminal cleavage/methylation domain-containing protein